MNNNPNKYLVLASTVFGMLIGFTLVKYFTAKEAFEISDSLTVIWIAGITMIIGFIYYHFKLADELKRKR